MKFIITIDDAEKETIESLIDAKLDFPVVIGVPAGLIGKKIEGKIIAPAETLRQAIKKLEVEIASHGYYHSTNSLSLKEKLSLMKRFIQFPDGKDMIERIKYFLMSNKAFYQTRFKYEISREVVKSKKILESLLRVKVLTYIYLEGCNDKKTIEVVSKNYKFGRSSDIGYNLIKDLKTDKRYNFKTISFSKNWYGFWIYWNNGFKLDPTHVREYRFEREFLKLLEDNGFIVENYKTKKVSYPLVDLALRVLAKASLIKLNSDFYLKHKVLRRFRNLKLKVFGYRTIEVVRKVRK